MFRELTKIVYDNTFKVTVLKEKINVLNYEEILIFESNLILVKTKEYLIFKILMLFLIISFKNLLILLVFISNQK